MRSLHPLNLKLLFFALLHHVFEPAGIYVAKLIRILLVIAAAYKPAGREFIVRLNNHPSCVASYFYAVYSLYGGPVLCVDEASQHAAYILP